MNKEVAEKNFVYIQDTFKIVSQIEYAFLELGQRLYKIQTEELFRPNYDSYTDFLKDININNSVASRLVKIYEKFCLEYDFKIKELQQVGWSKLAEIVPVIKSKKDAFKWIAYAETNPKSVLREMVKEKIEKKVPSLTCNDYYIIKICRDSNSKYVLADTRDPNYKHNSWHDGGT